MRLKYFRNISAWEIIISIVSNLAGQHHDKMSAVPAAKKRKYDLS